MEKNSSSSSPYDITADRETDAKSNGLYAIDPPPSKEPSSKFIAVSNPASSASPLFIFTVEKN